MYGDTWNVVGLDEIGLDALIGADEAQLQQQALVRAAGGEVVRQLKPVGARVQVMASPGTAIAATTSAEVEYRPQRLIRVHSFVIDSADAPNWEITNCEIAQTSQFITKGNVPGNIFSEVADGRRSIVKFDSADVGNSVIVTALNLTAASRNFKGVFFATSIIRAAVGQ